MAISAASVANMAALTRMAKPDVGKNTDAATNNQQKDAIINMIRDTNNDGKVSKAEKQAYAAQLEQFRAEIDRNGDGDLSFAEQVNFALRERQVSSGEIGAFIKSDTDKNGKISQAEADAYVAYQATLVRASRQP